MSDEHRLGRIRLTRRPSAVASTSLKRPCPTCLDPGARRSAAITVGNRVFIAGGHKALSSHQAAPLPVAPDCFNLASTGKYIYAFCGRVFSRTQAGVASPSIQSRDTTSSMTAGSRSARCHGAGRPTSSHRLGPRSTCLAAGVFGGMFKIHEQTYKYVNHLFTVGSDHTGRYLGDSKGFAPVVVLGPDALGSIGGDAYSAARPSATRAQLQQP